jgi:hypothetical protein
VEVGRTRWSDERIDDFALVVRDELRELRTEMREGFSETRAEIAALRADTNASFRTVYTQLGIERRWLVGMWVTTVLGFVALLVQLSLR